MKAISRLMFLKSLVINLVSLPTYMNLVHLVLGSLLQKTVVLVLVLVVDFRLWFLCW
jgi:hypothetical protein